MTREEAIKIFNTVLLFGKCDCPKEEIEECFNMAIKALEQEPKTGHWIMHERHRECSECKVWLLKDMPRNSYCPNCGAKMVEPQESEA